MDRQVCKINKFWLRQNLQIFPTFFLDPSPTDPLSITYPYPLWIHYPLCIRLSIHYPSCILIHYPVSITHPSRSSGATLCRHRDDFVPTLPTLAILCRHCRHFGDFVPTLPTFWFIVCLLFVAKLVLSTVWCCNGLPKNEAAPPRCQKMGDSAFAMSV